MMLLFFIVIITLLVPPYFGILRISANGSSGSGYSCSIAGIRSLAVGISSGDLS
jgi:hypothetical protein